MFYSFLGQGSVVPAPFYKKYTRVPIEFFPSNSDENEAFATFVILKVNVFESAGKVVAMNYSDLK